jgi:voltage-gated potassium channel
MDEPMKPVRGVSARLQRLMQGRSIYLLVSLLVLVSIGPWLTDLVSRGVWELLFTLVALSSIHMLGVQRGQALMAGLLALPTLASLWLRQLIPAVGLSQVALVLLTLFLLYTTATVLLHVFSAKTVTTDTLSVALCVYLLMGYLWGSLYGLIYLLVPGAFHLPMEWTPAAEQGIARDVPLNFLTYFSFMTLTTVGYGDVLPISGSARAAVTLEAVLGHFYLAVLVARLVGLHIADTRRPS